MGTVPSYQQVMPELSTILVIFLCLVVVALLSLRVRNLEAAVFHALETLKTSNSRAISLKKMAEVEATLSELLDAYDALLASHKKLRSRIGMRAVREQRSEIPDAQADPAGYKRAMRLKLQNGSL